MPEQRLAETVGYCGLLCGVCSHSFKGCKGCRDGGGSPECFQRTCCTDRQIEGCWQCADFPCDKGFFADDAWKGLCLGCVQCIKDKGIEAFAELAAECFGKVVDYGDYRHRDPEQIRSMLCQDSIE